MAEERPVERFRRAAASLQDIHGAPPTANAEATAAETTTTTTTTTTKKRVSYFEDAFSPSFFKTEFPTPTPQELLNRARYNLRHQQSSPNLGNVTSTLGATSSSFSAFDLSNTSNTAIASPSLSIADRRSVSLSTSDLSNISLDELQSHATTSTSDTNNTIKRSSSILQMPINRDTMFRRKPLPINTSLPLPISQTGPKTTPSTGSSAYTNLGEARNVSLPDALNTFSKQFFTTQQPYTQKGYLKEIDLNLNGNGTSAPFLQQVATKPGRQARFVENFDDDVVLDTKITGPLGGVAMSECRGNKVAMTMDGKGYTGYVNPKHLSEADKKVVSVNAESAGVADAATAESRDTARPTNPAFGVSTSPQAKTTIRPFAAQINERPSDDTFGSSAGTTARPSITSAGPSLRATNSEIRPFIITTRPSDDTIRPSTGTTGITLRPAPSSEALTPWTTTDSGQVRLSEGISIVNDNQNSTGLGDKNFNDLQVKKNKAANGFRRVVRKVSGGLIFKDTGRKASVTENRPPVPPKDTVRRK